MATWLPPPRGNTTVVFTFTERTHAHLLATGAPGAFMGGKALPIDPSLPLPDTGDRVSIALLSGMWCRVLDRHFEYSSAKRVSIELLLDLDTSDD
jgi:hypothetical protein